MIYKVIFNTILLLFVAENRAHRVGQTKEVTVYRLVCNDTIEERILELGNVKITLDDKLKEGVEDDEEEDIDVQDLAFILN